MLTNNFYAFVAALPLCKTSYNYISSLPITSTAGLRRYLVHASSNTAYSAATYNTAISNTEGATGIGVGTDGTLATADDWKLGSQITSGATISLSSHTQTMDSVGNPSFEMVISVKNTGSSDLTVREIGWIANLTSTAFPGTVISSNLSTVSCLLDRTVLSTPVVIASGETALINYYIKLQMWPKTVSGVEIVPFSVGTDEQIAAIIAAAHAGTIDLQADAGWRIGDIRKISVGAVDTFDAYNDFVFISSFDDYEGCGNVLQLDMSYLYLKSKMNSSNTNVGGYGSSYMATTFLPSVEAALPEWLRNLLLPFSVKASAGSSSSEIVTIQNNKLALRSEVEIFGTSTYSVEGEGSQVEAFKRSAYRNFTTGSSANRWLRSPYKSNSSVFVYESSSGGCSYNLNSTATVAVAPFMCV